ncbi:MAG: hypothetical protein U0414_16400 [Polyangiaceae bacterium]
MPADDRLAIVVSPKASNLRGGQGELDADAIKERLQLDDAAFSVVALDPSTDVAEQLDALFDARVPPEGAPAPEHSVLFYASTDVKIAGSEVFLCLDPESPDTGDSLHDVAEVICDRASGAVLFVLDARFEPNGDETQGAEIVAAARKVLKDMGDDIELLIGARPVSEAAASSCSPFTRAVLEVLDEADPAMGVSAEQIRDHLSSRAEALAAVRAFAHLPSQGSFLIVPGRTAVEVQEGSPESSADAGGPPSAAREVETVVEAPRHESPAPPPVEVSTLSLAASQDPPLGPDAFDAPPESITKPSAVAPAPADPPSSSSQSFFPSTGPDVGTLVEDARKLSRARDFEGALALYRKALGLGNVSKEVRGHVYLRMGSVKAAQSKSSEAIANFEKALTLVSEADVPRVLEELLTLYLAEKDYRAALGTQEKILKLLKNEGERFDALIRFGMNWLALPDDSPASSGPNAMQMRARQMLERAERIQPEHLDLLVMLKNLGDSEGRIEEVLGLRARIAEATTDPAQRAALNASLGKDLAKRGREDEAVALYEKALDAHPSTLDPLVGIAEILSEKQEWSVLESSYRRMLERLPRVEPESVRREVEWELQRRLGLLLRDHLDDHEHALRAFQAAVAAKPEDAHARKLAADAARATQDGEALEEQLLALVRIEPRDTRIYRMLFDLFMKNGEVERATAAASVLITLGTALDRERVVYEANKADGPPKLTTALNEEMWGLLRHRDLTATVVDRIFDAAAPAVAAALAEIVARTQAARLPDPKLKVDLAATTLSAVRALGFAGRSLGLEPPAVYVDDGYDGTYAVILADPPASRVGASALRGRSLPQLISLAARHLTYHAPQHRLLALCSAIEDLSACFLAVVSLVNKEVKAAPAVQRVIEELAPRIEAWLGAEEADEVASAVTELTESGGRADLLRYIASVERTSLRAGLLLAGDLGVAKSMAAEGLFQGGYRDVLTPDERLDELLSFSVSREYEELRARTQREID